MNRAILYILITSLVVTAAILLFYHNNPPHRARAYVDEWDDMSPYLPTDQIPFFAEHFSHVEDVLAKAMVNPNSGIRQRAAYVIEGLGHQAKSLEPDILNALQAEPDRTVRLYFYNALRSIGADRQPTLTYLRNHFLLLSQQQDDPSDGESYKTSDERVSLAAALFLLDKDFQQRSDYLDEVLQWLKPPSPALSPSELEEYWEHRWIAVIELEYMKGAEEAIPLLEEMLLERPTKPWVSAHVPRALKALRGTAMPHQE